MPFLSCRKRCFAFCSSIREVYRSSLTGGMSENSCGALNPFTQAVLPGASQNLAEVLAMIDIVWTIQHMTN